MALTVSGDIRYYSPIGDILTGSGFSQFGFSGWVRLNKGSGSNNNAVWYATNNTEAGFLGTSTNPPNVGIPKTLQVGTTYFYLHSFDGVNATVYWNGTATSKSIPMAVPYDGQGRLQVGMGPLTADYNPEIVLQDVAVWSGYAPTAADSIDLLTKVKTPLDVGNGAFVWYTLTGESGVVATLTSSGLTNWGTGGNKYSLNDLILQGTPGSQAMFTPEVMSQTLNIKASGYVTQNSGQVVFIFTNGGLPSYGPKINSDPNITVNGVFIQLTGAVTYASASYCMYDLGDIYISSADTVSYQTKSGWVQTNDGLLPGSSGYLTNYAGGNLWALPSSTTCKWGFNIAATPDIYLKNWFRKGRGVFTNAASSTSDGYPLQFIGNTGEINLWFPTTSNYVDTRFTPQITGTWTLDYKDHPTFSSTLRVYTPDPGLQVVPTKVGSYSVVMSGVRYTRQQYSVGYSGNVSYDGRINLQWTPFSPTGLNVRDLWLISPGNNLDTSNPFALDQNVINHLSTTRGKFAPVFRYLTQGFIGDTTEVTEDEFINPTGFQWIQPSRKIQPLYVRPYDLAVSPSALINFIGWVQPSSIDWLFNNYPSTNVRFAYEVATSGNHLLKTGHVPFGTNVGFGPMTVSGQDGYVYSVSQNLTNTFCVFVTSPSSFVTHGFDLNISSGGHIKTPIQQYCATGLYYTVAPPALSFNNAWEVFFNFSAAIPGCMCWFSAPPAATDAAHAAIARKAFNILPSGRKIGIEYTNEDWNFQFRQTVFSNSIANVLGYTLTEYYTLRSSQVHDIWDSVFCSGGRPSSIIRIFSNQYGSANHVDIVNTLLKYNLKADALAFAPYISFSIGDASVTGAISTWNNDKLHELYRHHLFYNSFDNYAFAVSTGIMNTYREITGTGLFLYAYEAATEYPFNTNIPNYNQKAIDWFYHRENYNTRNAFHLYNQSHGLNLGCFFTLFHVEGNPADLWTTIRHPTQQAGLGNSNKFIMDDGLPHDAENVSPALLAWKNYNDTTIGVPIMVNPMSIARLFPQFNSLDNSIVSSISARFNNTISPSTVRFTVVDTSGNNVPGHVTYYNNQIYFVRTFPLNVKADYIVTLSGVTDTFGSIRNPFSWSFQTTNMLK